MNRREFLRSTAPVASVAVGLGATVPAAARQALSLHMVPLAKTLEDASAALGAATEAKAAGRAAYDAAAPALPEAVLLTGYDRPLYMRAEREQDVEGQSVAAPYKPDRYFLPAYEFRRVLSGMDGRSSLSRAYKRRLRIAEDYEAGCLAARKASGIGEAIEAHYWRQFDVQKAASAVFEADAHSLADVTLKARAWTACAAVDRWGGNINCAAPRIMADVLRICGGAS